MQEEIWKDITWYEWLYQVSNFGKILSTKRAKTKWWILRPWSNPQGYVIASISKDSIVRYFTVHRLVALAFIPNPEWKDQINHKDGNTLNPAAYNVEWVSGKYNIQHYQMSRYITFNGETIRAKVRVAKKKTKAVKKWKYLLAAESPD